jgi:hypothetical protein
MAVTSDDASHTVVGPAAIVEGRAALILSRLLAGSLEGGGLRRRLTLRQLVAEMRMAPADQEAVLRAELALEDAGERWRLAQFPRRGNSETRGNEDDLACEAMSTRAAAQVIGRTPHRVTQLIRAGVLSAVRTPRGWALDRREVLEYAQGQLDASVAGVSDSAPPTVDPFRGDGRGEDAAAAVTSSATGEAAA